MIEIDPDPEFTEHLGDGVYASFDGFQLWLAANDHRNKVIAIEPVVMIALERYVKMLREKGAM